MSIPEKELSYPMFIDKLTCIYGKSGSGKTTIMIDMLYLLRKQVDQIIIFSQTDKQTKSFSREIVPIPLIYEDISSETLHRIYERQIAMATTYNQIWDDGFVSALFGRLGLGKVAQIIEEIKSKMNNTDDLTESEMSCKKIQCEEYIQNIYRKYINENSEKLANMNLSEGETKALKYINFNPRLIILFDDCSALFNKVKKDTVINKLFFQGRHARITTILALHSDKLIDPEQKKSVFVSIFTDAFTANSYFDKASTGLDSANKNRAKCAVRVAFIQTLKNQKLLYISNEDQFYRMTATLRADFQFCAPIVRDFCDKIKADGGISRSNKFAFAFT
jgi:ABC-type dipeptide/oligopeptide/nickel transport system ATPase subunit